jgi:hypothetical protein
VGSPMDRNEWNRLRIACALTLLCGASAIAAPAQTLNTLFRFDNTDGLSPIATLVQGATATSMGQPQVAALMAKAQSSR